MSIKLTKRAASLIMKRGVTAIRIKKEAAKEAKDALTREDVRTMIGKGSIYAIKEKTNMSIRGKELEEKRKKGRRRGTGKRKGTRKAREGLLYVKKIRGQRRILKKLKEENIIDNIKFKKFYKLSKGGIFQTKSSLLNRIRSEGTDVSGEKEKELKGLKN